MSGIPVEALREIFLLVIEKILNIDESKPLFQRDNNPMVRTILHGLLFSYYNYSKGFACLPGNRECKNTGSCGYCFSFVFLFTLLNKKNKDNIFYEYSCGCRFSHHDFDDHLNNLTEVINNIFPDEDKKIDLILSNLEKICNYHTVRYEEGEIEKSIQVRYVNQRREHSKTEIVPIFNDEDIFT